jgi:hypothetical protein
MFMALPVAWLRLQCEWICERRQFLWDQQAVDWQYRVGTIQSIRSPWILRAFGEPAVGLLIVPQDSSPELVARLRALFPEARLGTGNVQSPGPGPQPFTYGNDYGPIAAKELPVFSCPFIDPREAAPPKERRHPPGNTAPETSPVLGKP